MAVNIVMEAKRFRMKSSLYGDAVVASLKNLQQSDELADFTVIAEGRSVRVHKILLAAMSDYFRAMFLGPMKESKENNVDLKGLSAEALQHIIDFLYSGEMDLDLDNLHEILNASSHLQVQTAIDLCSDYIISLLTFSNSEDFLSIADTYSLGGVTAHYNEKVLKHFEEFIATEQFLNLSEMQIYHFLAADGIRIKSEVMLYDCIAKWYSHDQNRKQSLQKLLDCIRFGLMTEEQLLQLEHHWLTEQYLPAAKYIADGMKCHHELKHGHTSMESFIKVRSTEHSLAFVYQGSSYRPFEITAYNKNADQFYQLMTDISGSRDCRIISLNNFIYICRVVDCGGGTLMNSLVRFDPRHLTLVELTPCQKLRIDPSLVGTEQCLYILGGATERYQTLDSVECYNIMSNTWLDITPLPSATHSAAATVSGEHIYISGGAASDRQATSSVFAYSNSNKTWQVKPPLRCPRRLHEMLALAEKLYVLGGIGGPGLHYTQIPVEAFDIQTDQWTLLCSTLAGRSVGHFLILRGEILSFGREHHEATEEDIWMFDLKSDCWKIFRKVPRHSGLTSAYATLLSINFSEEKICQRIISNTR